MTARKLNLHDIGRTRLACALQDQPQTPEARREEMKYEKRNIIDWLFNYREPDPVEALTPKLPAAEAPWEYGQWHYT